MKERFKGISTTNESARKFRTSLNTAPVSIYLRVEWPLLCRKFARRPDTDYYCAGLLIPLGSRFVRSLC